MASTCRPVHKPGDESACFLLAVPLPAGGSLNTRSATLVEAQATVPGSGDVRPIYSQGTNVRPASFPDDPGATDVQPQRTGHFPGRLYLL